MPRTLICDGDFDPATMYVNGKGACAIVYCDKNLKIKALLSSKLQDSGD